MTQSIPLPEFDGGCLCGAVRWHAKGQPRQINFCHCSMCLKSTGAPVSAWALFKSENVTFTQGAPTYYKSSAHGERGFCAACGSTLTWRSPDTPYLLDLAVGTFDTPNDLGNLRDHIYTENAIAWFHVADDLPRFARHRPKPG
ncbi:MAG: GFA family protein [Alphaproteobacteria bacterium]